MRFGRTDDCSLVAESEKVAEESHRFYILTLRGSLILFIACAGQFFDDCQLTAVLIALPAISRDLGMRPDQIPWTVAAYSLVFAGFLPLAGAFADRFGNKRIFFIGTAWLSLFNLVAGFSTTPIQLIVFRAMCGLGAAATLPSCIGILASHIEVESQKIAYGFLGASGALGLGFGLLIGGGFTQSLTWQWTFWFQAPLILAVGFVALVGIPRDRVVSKNMPRLDFLGSFLMTAGIILFCFVLSGGPTYRWDHPMIISLLVVSVLMLVAFVYLEGKVSHPIMPYYLWRLPNFTVAFLMAVTAMGIYSTGSLYFAEISQAVLALSPLTVAIRLLPMTLSGVVISLGAGILANRLPLRYTASCCVFAAGIGAIPLATMTLESDFWTSVFPSSLILSTGTGGAYVLAIVVAMSNAPSEIQSFAGGVVNCGFFLGSGICLAINTAVFTSITGSGGAHSTSAASIEVQLKGYAAASWCIVGYGGLAGILCLLFIQDRRPLPSKIEDR